MGIFNFFKKEKVPDELPLLVSDEIEKEKNSSQEERDAGADELPLPLAEKKPDSPNKVWESPVVLENKDSNNEESRFINPRSAVKNRVVHGDDIEEGYFNELEDNLNKGITDLNKLENWYKNKFLPRDIVNDMKKHWEGKKNSSAIGILGRNFKDRINEKTFRLQKLEKEWQDIYFDLIEKEEEIREQEKDLKKMLAEFVEICKRKKKQKTGKKQ